jgi:hypothetical protein
MAPGLSEDGDHPSIDGYRLLGTRALEPAVATIEP